MFLIPGVIDDQVHFREPGLTHKGNIASESAAAVAGGVTSFMEMPNTKPQATSIEELEKKYAIASESSWANYSFYLGATNDNIDEVSKINPKNICGLKVFMGSSTGNMLVDNDETLCAIFKESPVIITTHCEDEAIIQANTRLFRDKYGDSMPFKYHADLRSAEACYKSSSKAIELATKHNGRLHVLHISTEKEMSLFSDAPLSKEKKITGEVCVHHLWFTIDDYDKYGSRIKWNPAVKYQSDRDALREALMNGKLDVVATDHAPHTLEEKNNCYFNAPSGGPLVQHSLVAMLEMVDQGIFTYEQVVDKMCHAPAKLFDVDKRGYIKEGYYADLVLVNPNKSWLVSEENILYKCKWSPFEGTSFIHVVDSTFINGKLTYSKGQLTDKAQGERLIFNR